MTPYNLSSREPILESLTYTLDPVQMQKPDDSPPIVLDIRGEIDVSSSRALGSLILENIDKTETLVLKMDGVHFMDASGYRTLAMAHKSSQEQDKQLKIANPSRQVKRLLDIVMAQDKFEIIEIPPDNTTKTDTSGVNHKNYFRDSLHQHYTPADISKQYID